MRRKKYRSEDEQREQQTQVGNSAAKQFNGPDQGSNSLAWLQIFHRYPGHRVIYAIVVSRYTYSTM